MKKRHRKHQILGWIAVGLSTVITCILAFWGIVENFHEGWYYESWLSNVGMMFVQYLSPMLIFMTVTLVSIVGKVILTLLLRHTGNKVESHMLIANAKNMRNDILISISVLASLFFTEILNEPLIDRLIAILISFFIMISAFRIFMKSNIDLMDGIDDTGLYNQLFEAVRQVDGAFNPHRVRARKIGYHYMVNLDIEVNSFLSVKEAHEIARNVENSIKTNLPNIYDVMVHVEPLGNKEEDEKYGITESDIKNQLNQK